jgi:acetoin utilization deacetylase AcuC-like enzyme
MSQLALISHPDCRLHEMGTFHPEQPARLAAIEQALIRAGLDKSLLKWEAPLATREQLLRVHEAGYIDDIVAHSPTQGLIPLDPDTAMNPYTLQAALRAAGAVVLAVDAVLQGKTDAVFCNVRPPGHHAERARAMGFCFFNNVAVGVAHALERYGLHRVAIVDFDVHHGNGTEDIFNQEKRVLFCSSFQHPFYPGSGADTHSEHIINLPLASGTTGQVFRERARAVWFKAIAAFKPELIFFSAGFDAYAHDEMANLQLMPDDYAWLTQEVKKITADSTQGRVIPVLEGGYDLEGLGQCALAHIQALL